MAQSVAGGIRLHDDFRSGTQALVASSVAPPLTIGNGTYKLVGQGVADDNAGLVFGARGATITASDEADHATGLTTGIVYDVATNGTLAAETRIENVLLTERQVFFGFSDVQTDLAIIEGAIIKGSTTTLTLTASDICGFLLASELTDAADWHAVYNGGTATGETDSRNVDLDTDAVSGDFQILRIEIDRNGTARWFVDGKLKKTLKGAVSTTVDLCLSLIAETKVTTEAKIVADYLTVKSNRDWTV